ncbi:MAG: hypothetical protein LBR00_03185 [Clostridiales Family XIII bacterium]|jgi:hypothetical protein|nr:hypothetical protein [Clostridiales Family XIII bacterium]
MEKKDAMQVAGKVAIVVMKIVLIVCSVLLGVALVAYFGAATGNLPVYVTDDAGRAAQVAADAGIVAAEFAEIPFVGLIVAIAVCAVGICAVRRLMGQKAFASQTDAVAFAFGKAGVALLLLGLIFQPWLIAGAVVCWVIQCVLRKTAADGGQAA